MSIDYASDITARRNLISATFRQFYVKDPVTTMKKQIEKFGPEFGRAFEFAYEVKGTACQAVCDDFVDEKLCRFYGWKTIRELREQSYQALKSDIENARF